MDQLRRLFDLLIHLDAYLVPFLAEYGEWTYAILFLIVFAETGLVVTPFLPGDSLLFAAGTLAATHAMRIEVLIAVLLAAAILGDTVNYRIGYALGVQALRRDGRIIKRSYLERTEAFYARYGAKTIVLARFVPIVRTFAPFLAGAGRMAYGRFLTYNVVGGAAWVFSMTLGGYWLGNVRVVRENLGLVLIGIVLVSVMPGVLELVRHRLARRRAVRAGDGAAEAGGRPADEARDRRAGPA